VEVVEEKSNIVILSTYSILYCMPPEHPVASQTKNLYTTVKETLAAHKNGTVTVLSSLLAVEDALGYIPPEAIEAVAVSTSTTTNDVWSVASFYTNFRFTPPGEHVVEVCWGPSCHMKGAAAVVREVLSSLGMSTEGDTEDRTFTFKYNTCLGACAQAPVISVDHQLIGRLAPEQARQRIEALRPNSGSSDEP
jgi:NADH-quinone oxidoreductase subunit E